jgi:biopolymer transport protein ExbB
MTILSIFLKGGPLMFVLLALSFLGVGIIIGKYRQIFRISNLQKRHAAAIGKLKSVDDINTYLKVNNDDSPLVLVLNKAVTLVGEDYAMIKDSIESTANIAIHKLENGLGWLSTIAAVAPLIGFLGTVTGMVRVFINIAAHSQQGIDITLLANGIWEALLTTVGGLIVGIPAIIFYNDLVAHTGNNAKLLQEEIDEMMIKLFNKK